MILVWLITILFAGGIGAWLSEKRNPELPRVIALATILLDLFLVVLMLVAPGVLGLDSASQADLGQTGEWLVLSSSEWIPRFRRFIYLWRRRSGTIINLPDGVPGLNVIGLSLE